MTMKQLIFAAAIACLSACAGGHSEGMQPGDCSDGVDNDGDGAYDCNDPDCLGAPSCQHEEEEEPDYSQLAGLGEPCHDATDCNPNEADACLVERGQTAGVCSLECDSNSDCSAADGMKCESLCRDGWWCVQEDDGCTESACMDECCEQYNCNDGFLYYACRADCEQSICRYCDPVDFDLN